MAKGSKDVLTAPKPASVASPPCSHRLWAGCWCSSLHPWQHCLVLQAGRGTGGRVSGPQDLAATSIFMFLSEEAAKEHPLEGASV